MSGDGSISPSVRVDWGTPQASASTTTSAAPDARTTEGSGSDPASVIPLCSSAKAATTPAISTGAPKGLDTVIADYLASNDPVPKGAAHEIGDGDFRAIGAEFLRHFIELGGLAQRDDVLDIGCGFGRMALPLARFLAPEARYLGFDIAPEPVQWCRDHIAPLRPGFSFEHVDVRHPLYNAGGALPEDAGFLGRIVAPPGWRPTFIAAVSVLTHLEQDAIVQLLADARAVLPPGGRLFLTAFMTGPHTPAPAAATRFPVAAWREAPPLFALLGEPLTAAVGVNRNWLEEILAGLGYRIQLLQFGHWRDETVDGTPFQDVVVAVRV